MAHPRNPPEARQPPAARKRKPAPARQPAKPLGFGNLFGQALGGRQARREVTASRPVDTGQGQIGRQLLNLSATGRFTPERVLRLLSSVPALKKFPVATKQLAAAPGLGERILRLVTTRAKRGELVTDKEFLGLIESQARSGLRR